MGAFKGLTEDAFRFFWEISFQNEKSFFEENRERYEREVKIPMRLLAQDIAGYAQDVDPNFITKPTSVVSRIYRDTRFSRDKSPYRDHVWLAYKYPGKRLGESFVLYAEVERDSYGYGMGMYAPEPAYMNEIRKRILARPQLFLSLVHEPKLCERFTLYGDEYKRPKCPDAPEELWPWLNKRKISYSFSSQDISRTMRPELVDEIKEGFDIIKPLYRFIQGID
ncbi:DUF2461 domain-containing protein [Eubacteriales bacterium OttesenSCG-928-K08]|nr:DUF2461 domain-containing protein [Eubacteriales bacterium OttesenSCG-928-K08]